MGFFFLYTDANYIAWGRLSCRKMLNDLEKKKESASEQSQVVALTSSLVEETRQVIMRFFNLPDGCRWVQKEIEKDRQRKVN